jgi:hypothetical protein
MRLEVERAELINADDHVRVARLDIDGAVHQAVQVQDAVLLASKSGACDCFQLLLT